jgi:WD40 repeat protein
MKDLSLRNIIGFSGAVPNALKHIPNSDYVIYPLGSMLILKDQNTNAQHFLQGHTNLVTCLSVSKSGKFIASGQMTHMGYLVPPLI